jgi:hypothetical protein
MFPLVGIRQSTLFLLAIDGIGTLQNIDVASSSRLSQEFGVPLQFVEVIEESKVKGSTV